VTEEKRREQEEAALAAVRAALPPPAKRPAPEAQEPPLLHLSSKYGALADDEDVLQAGGEGVTDSVLHVESASHMEASTVHMPTFEPLAADGAGTTRPASILMDGCPVLLKGLKAKPEWNGKRARIMSFLPDAGKYEIKMEDLNVTVKAKPENVELIVKAKETKKEKLKRKPSDMSSTWQSRRETVLEAVRNYISENENSWTKSLMKEELAEKLDMANDSQMAVMVNMALGELKVSTTGGLNIKGTLRVHSPSLTPPKRARVKLVEEKAEALPSPDFKLPAALATTQPPASTGRA